MRLKTLGSRLATLDTRAAPPAVKRAEPFYLSPGWRALMARLIRERGRRCQDARCKTPHRTGIRVFGDHIEELKDCGDALDETNILLRCGSCHTRKTNEQRAKRLAAPLLRPEG